MSNLKIFRIIVFQSIICFGLVIISPTPITANPQKTLKINWGRSSEAQRIRHKIDSSKAFQLQNRDEKKVEAFRVMYLLRLYGVFRKMYIDHLAVANGWSGIASDYAALAAVSKEFAVIAKDDPVSNFFYSRSAEFLTERAGISSDIDSAFRSGRIPNAYSRPLFNSVVLFQGNVIGYDAKYRPFFEPLINRINNSGRLLVSSSVQVNEGWQSAYGFDTDYVLNSTGLLPFKLPFMEFKDDDTGIDYLYDAFIRGAGLSWDLESYYRGDLRNAFYLLANETLFKAQEIALIWGIEASYRIPAPTAVRVFLYAVSNCLNKMRKENRAAHYREANRMHQMILNYLKAGSDVVSELRQLATRKKSGLVYNKAQYELLIDDLVIQADSYLAQRKRLASYPSMMEQMTAALVSSSESGASDLLISDTELSAFAYAIVYKKPYTEVLKMYAKDKSLEFADPCGRLIELVKSAFKASTKKANASNKTTAPSDPTIPIPTPKTYDFEVYTGGATDLSLKKGATITITATGTISLGFFAGSSSPNGIEGYETFSYFSNVPHGSLLVRVAGTKWMLCGSRCTFTAGQAGRLEFLVNDRDSSNNQGAYEVTVVVR